VSQYSDEPLVLGCVVEQGRGSLPFALIHGESLVACAAWALGEAGVQAIDMTASWVGIADSARANEHRAFVLHDALCPMTPAAFIAACVERALETGTVVVGVRPVTDTVKTVVDGLISDTLDREQLLTVTSPIVLPAAVVAALGPAPSDDFVALVGELADRFEVTTVEAPPEGRRVVTPEDVKVLEALTRP